ncbi:MAG: hypothetical protein CSA45_06115 [Gammaproteobacteria bacterium]|nr:MAG: hypothetical protein CSA45_06115 [Gammaproteobacteria bacterium]
MTLSWLGSVFIFALVTAASPGPVNLLAMSAGTSAPLSQGLRFVFGATTGFCLLVLLSGLGLQSLIKAYPEILTGLRLGGAAFLLWLAWLLWRADGRIDNNSGFRPSFLRGALLQWLNPKAWLSSLSIVSLYAPSGLFALGVMTSIYYIVCFCSIAAWLLAGYFLAKWLQNPVYLQRFNRSLAVLLLISLIYLFL